MSDIITLCNDSTYIKNCNYYFLGKLHGNTTISLAFDTTYIYKYSCDWLSLIINYFYQNPNNDVYIKLKDTFLKNTSSKGIYIPGNSVLVSTSFSSGTVHGYVGIFEILIGIQYTNYDTYIVHQNAQKGIKDLIEIAIPKEKIYYMAEDTLYTFEQLTLIPIKTHNFHYTKSELPYLEGTIYPFIKSLLFTGPLPIHNSICILKSSQSSNLTVDGIFQFNEIELFCKTNGCLRIEPTEYSEDKYARIIHGTMRLIVSFGTTFFKAMLYISDQCKQIDVLVYGKNFEFQYKSYEFPSRYKEANISYHIVSSLEDFAKTLQ